MKKKLIACLLVLLLLSALPVHAEAVRREVSVYLYHAYEDCVFFISWQNAAPGVAVDLTSPEGTLIATNEHNATIHEKGMMVKVGDAPAGNWLVSVTGENLGVITVTGGENQKAAIQNNAIQGFTVDIDNDLIRFSWDVLAQSDRVSLSIYASQGMKSNSRTLFTDYSASKKGHADVSVDTLQSGLYSFFIQVYDGAVQHTLSTDLPIYVKQPNAPTKLEGIKVGSIDGEAFITWDSRLNTSYFVTVYEYDTLSVISAESVYTNYYPITMYGHEKVKVSVSAVEDGVYGEMDVYEILFATPPGTITFPTESTTHKSILKMEIDCPQFITAGVYLDGVLLLEETTADSYDLHLSEGIHEIVAYLQDEQGNRKTFSKAITVDKTPPLLHLNLKGEETTPSDTILVEGSTDPNAIVAINGLEQQIRSGSFLAKLTLKKGRNPVTVSAYDQAGNKSLQTVVVRQTSSFGDGWTGFILPGIALLLLGAWYVYLNQKAKGAMQHEEID